MSKRKELLSALENDTYGLLKDGSAEKKLTAEESSLVYSFEEIQAFVEENRREPLSNFHNIHEFKLYSRLNAIRSDAKKVKLLKKYDFNNLLQGKEFREMTLEDAIADDPFNLLKSDSQSDIFELKHVKVFEKIKLEYIARRKVCKDFAQYKPMFETLHQELISKKRKFIKYKSSDLEPGRFYALDGILLFMESIDGKIDNYTFNSGGRDRFDGKTLCVFDNGTQSDMLFRSLDKAMQLGGYSISDCEPNSASLAITDSDIVNGYIYVLKSRNVNVQHIPNLYKIGHTSGSVIERIRGAKNQATYLFDEVDVVSTFRCFNVLSYNLEQRLHAFLSAIRLDIELTDHQGNAYRPKEWFIIDIGIIEEAIRLIINNELDGHAYDYEIKQIIKIE